MVPGRRTPRVLAGWESTLAAPGPCQACAVYPPLGPLALSCHCVAPVLPRPRMPGVFVGDSLQLISVCLSLKPAEHTQCSPFMVRPSLQTTLSASVTPSNIPTSPTRPPASWNPAPDACCLCLPCTLPAWSVSCRVLLVRHFRP